MLESYYDCVGPGWKIILEALGRTFSSVLIHAKSRMNLSECSIIVDKVNDDDPDPKILINQIKEKFGGLRVYVEMVNITEALRNEVYGSIAMAENLALRICENCGSTEDVAIRGRGWVKSLCFKCVK